MVCIQFFAVSFSVTIKLSLKAIKGGIQMNARKFIRDMCYKAHSQGLRDTMQFHLNYLDWYRKTYPNSPNIQKVERAVLALAKAQALLDETHGFKPWPKWILLAPAILFGVISLLSRSPAY